MRFAEQTGEQFNLATYVDRPEIFNLMRTRRELIEQGERKRKDFSTLVGAMYAKGKEGALDAEAIRSFVNVLKTDFGIEPTEAHIADRKWDELFERYTEDWRSRIDAITAEVEKGVAREPVAHDLTINSWMPVGMDLTNEAREANGAAIIYVVERGGATGCRSDAPWPQKPSRLGDGESYTPGIAYESRHGWISHSTPQVTGMLTSQPDRIWEYTNSFSPPFANGFIVQTKKGYGEGNLAAHSSDGGLRVDGMYPWEEELTERGGEIAPVIPLHNESGKTKFYWEFEQLADRLEKEERTKRG